MSDLSFGEQVKIVLSRKGMTIKELAETIEERTGKKMSRQNLTQRLGRDNFQEQDMRMIASILGCSLKLSILEDEMTKHDEEIKSAQEDVKITVESVIEETIISQEIKDEGAEEQKTEEETAVKEIDAEVQGTKEDIITERVSEEETAAELQSESQDKGMTVGEFLELQENAKEDEKEKLLKEVLAEMDALEREDRERTEQKKRHIEELEKERKEEPEKKHGWQRLFGKHEKNEQPVTSHVEQEVSANEEGEQTQGGTSSSAEHLQDHLDETSQDAAQEDLQNTETNQQKKLVDEYDDPEDLTVGELNPYTGREYNSNSVRMHPTRLGYVQVYSRKDHKWTDMTEWAFLGEQERRKTLLGKKYRPPIYLD